MTPLDKERLAELRLDLEMERRLHQSYETGKELLDTIDVLRETIRWVAQTVHRAYHKGAFMECSKNTCDAARQSLNRGEEEK